jgi:hypothetical protein
MSPVAIAMTAIIPFQMPTTLDTSIPEAYDQEVVTAAQSESKPAVFILVFDEMGYDILLQEEKLDEDSFPNFAALAQDGIWFTNATSNYFWSKDSVPTVFDPLWPLTEDFNVRIYTQYLLLEKRYYNDCGNIITCRGITYVTQHQPLRAAGNLTLRAFYEAAPRPAEKVISRPMGWFLDRLGWDYPSVSRAGGLTLSKALYSQFIDDIDGESALGRIYALHLALPHGPFVFDKEGDAIDSASPEWGQETFQERYREQVMFVDRLFGQFIDKLKEQGIYDRSVIILTSDHGPRPFRPTLEKPPFRETPRIPLVIHAPGLGSGISDVDYQHIDFGSTLADLLGMPPPAETKGVSAFSPERPERDKVFHANPWTFAFSPEDGIWHVIQDE